MSSYLELFAKAVGMKLGVERSPYELEKTQESVADHGRREMDSTRKESSSSEEKRETESKERSNTEQALKRGNELLRGYKYILSCTCGSWGHLCEAVEHYCPTKCLREVPID